MTTTDWTAILAIVLSSGALILEVRRWVESGVRIRLSVIGDVILIPDDDGFAKLSLWAANIGAKPTTITNFAVEAFKSPVHRLLNRPHFTAIVANSSFSPIPAKLDLGDRWHSQMYYDPQTWDLRKSGCLFVGVYSTDRRKARLIRVPKPNKEAPVFRP